MYAVGVLWSRHVANPSNIDDIHEVEALHVETANPEDGTFAGLPGGQPDMSDSAGGGKSDESGRTLREWEDAEKAYRQAHATGARKEH